jgi:hypothetical protein
MPTTSLPAVRTRRWQLTPPDGLAAWRADRPPISVPRDRDQVMAVLAGVRQSLPRQVVAERAGVSETLAMDVVAGAGARAGQANKRGPRASVCMSAARGARHGLEPGLHDTPDGLVVVLADGWARTRTEPRDVSRSYAATVLASPDELEAAVDRYLDAACGTGRVTYQHLAHLYSVSRGTFATLTGITTDPLVQEVYVTAFDMLEQAIRATAVRLRALLDPCAGPADVAAAAPGCRWLLGRDADVIADLAAAVAGGRTGGERLARHLQALREAQRTRGLIPWSLGSLTRTQFRALATELGYPVPEDDEGTHDGTGEHALRAALARIAAEHARTAGEQVLPGRVDGVMRAPAGVAG